MNLREEVKLICEEGRPVFGIYRSPFSVINFSELRSYGKYSPVLAGIIKRTLNLKRWQYLGICNDDIIFGMAVVNLGYLSNMFCYLFDRKRKEIFEYSRIHPFGINKQTEGSSVSGKTIFKCKAANYPEGERKAHLNWELSKVAFINLLADLKDT